MNSKEQSMSAKNLMMAKRMRPAQDEWEKLGFVFADIPNDDVLCFATMPEGWDKRETEHPLWFEIVDENENVRGSMFYKSALYERSARMSLRSRYGIFSRQVGEGYLTKEVYFGNPDETLFIAGQFQIKKDATREEIEAQYAEEDRLKALAQQYGDENYPGWESIDSYWESSKESTNKQVTKQK